MQLLLYQFFSLGIIRLSNLQFVLVFGLDYVLGNRGVMFVVYNIFRVYRSSLIFMKSDIKNVNIEYNILKYNVNIFFFMD